MKEKHTQMREHGEEHTCTKEDYYYEQLCYVLQQLPWPANKHAPLSLSLTHTQRKKWQRDQKDTKTKQWLLQH
jgi:hypothetical protein